MTLPSGSRAAAQIVARDHSRMLVLLKVNTSEKLTVPAAAPRGEMTVGQWAIAVGRTYEQPQPNVSVGVLSATNRIWSTAIQTDAKISPANYGGPLIDIQGRVLGVLVPLSPQKQARRSRRRRMVRLGHRLRRFRWPTFLSDCPRSKQRQRPSSGCDGHFAQAGRRVFAARRARRRAGRLARL